MPGRSQGFGLASHPSGARARKCYDCYYSSRWDKRRCDEALGGGRSTGELQIGAMHEGGRPTKDEEATTTREWSGYHRMLIITFTWSRPRGVAGYIEAHVCAWQSCQSVLSDPSIHAFIAECRRSVVTLAPPEDPSKQFRQDLTRTLLCPCSQGLLFCSIH
jgi:hypothetical protein